MAEKQYVIDNAELMAEWNWDKNNELGLMPHKLTCGSGVKTWWKCLKGHEWSASIINRSKHGSNCPYCSGRKPILGENDLESTNPKLSSEWHTTRNQGLTPHEVSAGSHIKVWWICNNGHEWQATIKDRNLGNGCPYCSGRYAIKGENDLQTINPTLANEWNYEMNNGLTPVDVLPNSGNKVWWKCIRGHEWQAAIAHRSKGAGCPYCAGQNVLKGYNDLETVNPTLANEWNYEKNGNLKPESFTANSGKNVWWKCSKGHEWQAKIYHRNNGSDCPVCSSERNTSFPEYVLVYYLNKYGVEVMHSYKEYGYELDVFIPAKKIAIEYDGYFWHRNKTQEDLEKNRKCKKDGIKLYRIREGLLPLNDSSIDYVIQKNQKDLPQILEKILSNIIDKTIDIDLARDAISIENLREYTEKENSLLYSNPEIAKNGIMKRTEI